jgi:hypothetical protein
MRHESLPGPQAEVLSAPMPMRCAMAMPFVVEAHSVMSLRESQRPRQNDVLENGTYQTRPGRQASTRKCACEGALCRSRQQAAAAHLQQRAGWHWLKRRSAHSLSSPSQKSSRRSGSTQPGLEPELCSREPHATARKLEVVDADTSEFLREQRESAACASLRRM